MSIEITTAFKKQYEASFKLVYQQMVSQLSGTVRNETQNAEVKFWDFVGATTAVRDRARGSATPRINTPHTRRACKLHSLTWADTTSDLDKIQAMADPTSDYLRAGVAAIRRGEDELLLEAAYADVLTGKEGTTTVTAATECYKVNGDGTAAAPGTALSGTTETGLTIAKLALIGARMDDKSVPTEDRYLIANSDQKWYLLGSAKATNADYAGQMRALMRGEIPTFLGFHFIWLPSDRFTANTTDTGCYQCVAYQRDAMLLAMAKDVTTEVDRLPDENYDVQAFAEQMAGAVRLQADGVVPILLKKAPGMDFTQA